MITIGIHDGHNACATLVINGKIIENIQEERINRDKNFCGFPKKSINEILKINNINPHNVDSFIYSSNFMHSDDHLKNYKSWHAAGYQEQKYEKQKSKIYLKSIFDLRKRQRIKNITEYFNVDSKKIFFMDHHLSHASAAYLTSHYKKKDRVLIFTCDGAGDGISSTVSMGFNGEIKRLASTKRKASIGKIFSRVTYYLGFSPWEHEYKLMGLAPYANIDKAKKLSLIFRKITDLKKGSLVFHNPSKLESSYIYSFLKQNLEKQRFDEISAGIQIYTEDLLLQWIKTAIQKYKVNKIALGGGTFMNIKANFLLKNLKEVKDIYVSPSCGDESLSMGSALYFDFTSNNNKYKNLSPIKSIYYGHEFSDEIIENSLKKLNSTEYKITKSKNIEKKIARLLSENKIVARYSGKMEWGARSLGNRSILANPSNFSIVQEINKLVKKRDFWMPFAPTILKEYSDKYIVNKKNITSRHMMIGFESSLEGKNKLSAAIHPYDMTMRPQILNRIDNPLYYKMIKEFKNITGIGAVLNTSFNLHGFPIVYTPDDAISVLKKTGLQYLAIGNYLIKKN